MAHALPSPTELALRRIQTPDAMRDEAARVRRTGDRLAIVLWVVAIGCLAFTMVNVYNLAVAHKVPAGTAWILDPIMSISLFAVLVGDGVLSRHGIASIAWAQVLKYSTGAGTLAMNVWQPVADHDRAGVLLHASVPVLMVLLAEATPAYRRRMSDLADALDVGAGLADRESAEESLRRARDLAAEEAEHATRLALAEAERRAAERAAKGSPVPSAKPIQRPARKATQQVKADIPSGLTDSAVTVWSFMLGKGDVLRKDIVAKTGLPVSTVKTALDLLTKLGRAVSVSRGVYRSVDPDMNGQSVADATASASPSVSPSDAPSMAQPEGSGR